MAHELAAASANALPSISTSMLDTGSTDTTITYDGDDTAQAQNNQDSVEDAAPEYIPQTAREVEEKLKQKKKEIERLPCQKLSPIVTIIRCMDDLGGAVKDKMNVRNNNRRFETLRFQLRQAFLSTQPYLVPWSPGVREQEFAVHRERTMQLLNRRYPAGIDLQAELAAVPFLPRKCLKRKRKASELADEDAVKPPFEQRKWNRTICTVEGLETLQRQHTGWGPGVDGRAVTKRILDRSMIHWDDIAESWFKAVKLFFEDTLEDVLHQVLGGYKGTRLFDEADKVLKGMIETVVSQASAEIDRALTRERAEPYGTELITQQCKEVEAKLIETRDRARLAEHYGYELEKNGRNQSDLWMRAQACSADYTFIVNQQCVNNTADPHKDAVTSLAWPRCYFVSVASRRMADSLVIIPFHDWRVWIEGQVEGCLRGIVPCERDAAAAEALLKEDQDLVARRKQLEKQLAFLHECQRSGRCAQSDDEYAF